MVHDRKELVQVSYPVVRDRRQFFVGHDDYEVDIGPAVALTCKRAYYGDTVDSVVVAQQAGYSLRSLFSLFWRKQGHTPPFYSTRGALLPRSQRLTVAQAGSGR